MEKSLVLVVFALDDQRYALKLDAVERVLPAVEITPLPKAPDIVLGIIDVAGRVMPVFNVRRRFGLPEREIELSDEIIVARATRPVALLVERVLQVVEYPAGRVIPAGQILPDLEYISGAVKLEDGLVLIHDLDTFLSLDEERALERALAEREGVE